MKRSQLIAATTLFAATVGLVGCVDGAAGGRPDGITFDTQEPDHVAGRYVENGVELAFDFSRSNGQHSTAFSRADGTSLITTTLEGALQTTNVLDGRLMVSGIPNMPDPSVMGDETAMDELYNLPEAGLLQGMGDALASEDIDPTLLDPKTPELEREIDNAPGYFHLFYQQSMTFLSKAGAAPTYIWLRKVDSAPDAAQLWINPWSLASSFFHTAYDFGVTYTATRYWWGAAFTVTCVSFYNACNVSVSRW